MGLNNKFILALGANYGIGLPLVKIFLPEDTVALVFATHRPSNISESLKKLKEDFENKLILIPFEATNNKDFNKLMDTISEHTDHVDISLNCIGVLESEKIKAEKSIEEVNKSSLLNAIEINAFTSIHLAQVLKSFIKNSESPVFATLSAKVGSIEDNRLGGWYSYRISKVALNMALKNISIEFKRLNKNFNAFAIHPGTTETQITKKYLKSARKKYQIHSPDETAENIYNCILEAQSQAYNGRFLTWNGDTLPW